MNRLPVNEKERVTNGFVKVSAGKNHGLEKSAPAISKNIAFI